MQAIFRPKNTLNWVLQEFAGPDARDFLNRMTTVNVQQLRPSEGGLGFFLSASGKIRAQFFLGCVSEDRFVFEYDAGKNGEWISALSGTIEQFTFAERQQLSSPSSNECIWIFLGSGQDLPGREALSGSLILEHGSRDFGLVWFSVWGESELLRSWQLKYFAEAQLWDWSELDRRR
ncbi:MAG: hypothetical protein EBS60_09695, partial [Verrucomicrobia bacterium]|nr:hypothetical protein [Verrucomicrobiota bacterium]